MRAAKLFVKDLDNLGVLDQVKTLKINLYGSLAQTGVGHGTPNAILMGIEGETPEFVITSTIIQRCEEIKKNKNLCINGTHTIDFDFEKDLRINMHLTLDQHPNGMRFSVFNSNGDMLATNEYFSIGGGFVVNKDTTHIHGENVYYKKSLVESGDSKHSDLQNEDLEGRQSQDMISAALPFSTASDLMELCRSKNLSIAEVVMLNELHWRDYDAIVRDALKIWDVMNESIRRGCTETNELVLPGRIKLKRRAPGLYKNLFRGIYGLTYANSKLGMNNIIDVGTVEMDSPSYKPVSTDKEKAMGLLRRTSQSTKSNFLSHVDYLSVYAIAVNEENAAGGRVVTAPTNGAAGIIPAVLKYYLEFYSNDPIKDTLTFLFTASAIGMLYKRGASISAAEMGCQGEVGVACSMSAAGFAAVMGATLKQVENAAEIGMEHNLGLTCDPVDGLVQIPCIERNALGAVKAVTAAQLALNGDGSHVVTLDQVIETMRQTGTDMALKYRETSLGGLAVNVPLC
ncbi:L-serine dehydratase [Smittium mucronatum]|uniref:L-serine dehydratase n=1 Tax=Smittium mucronatum TaxID=133383 RepID=A0A1R0GND2_9FUNG|nr:L-serine dehydratase [Smittium mucronatum]